MQDEGGYWYSTLNTIYVRYVSNDASYGANYALWPPSFTRYAEHQLGLFSIGRLADARTDKETLMRDTKLALNEARSRDAQKEPTQFPPESSWNRARKGRYGLNRKDYGSM